MPADAAHSISSSYHRAIPNRRTRPCASQQVSYSIGARHHGMADEELGLSFAVLLTDFRVASSLPAQRVCTPFEEGTTVGDAVTHSRRWHVPEVRTRGDRSEASPADVRHDATRIRYPPLGSGDRRSR